MKSRSRETTTAATRHSRKPKVSVVTVTYNRLALLKEAIASIQAQGYENWEHIIINDGSTDGTQAFLDAYAKTDARVRVFHQGNEAHFAKALNFGLQHASGKYFFKMDDDDIARRTKLEKCVAALESHEDRYYAVGVRASYFVKSKQISYADYSHIRELEPRFFRTKTLRYLNGWNEFYPRIEDTEFLFRAEEYGYKTVQLPQLLYDYRQMTHTSLARGREVLAYRFLIFGGMHIRRQWGLPDLTKQGWSRAKALDAMWGNSPTLPYVARHALEQMGTIRYRLFRTAAGWSILFSTYRIAHEMARFPYEVLWRHSYNFWQMLSFARLSIWQKLRGLNLLCQLYFPSPYKRLARGDALLRNDDMAPMPRVSVILPIAHERQAVHAAIKAIQDQTIGDWELLVVDYGAPRSTRRMVRRLARRDARIAFFTSWRKIGYWDALEKARALAQGTFLCRHDIGSYPRPHYFEAAIKTLNMYSYKQVLGIRGAMGSQDIYLPIFVRRRYVKPKQGPRSRKFFPPELLATLWDGKWLGPKSQNRWLADVEFAARARRRGVYVQAPYLLYHYDTNTQLMGQNMPYIRIFLGYMRHVRDEISKYNHQSVIDRLPHPLAVINGKSEQAISTPANLKRMFYDIMQRHDWGIHTVHKRYRAGQKSRTWLIGYIPALWQRWTYCHIPLGIRLALIWQLMRPGHQRRWRRFPQEPPPRDPSRPIASSQNQCCDSHL